MATLHGLKEYLDQFYLHSVFDEAVKTGTAFEFRIHGQKAVKGTVVENLVYDIKLKREDREELLLPKIQIKFLYPADSAPSLRRLIRTDKKVRELGLGPIFSPNHRYFIKNKSLFPLMMEREVVFLTLLEGEMIRGLIAGFNRYELTVNLKGGIPVTVFRHCVYDIRNKQGRCFLKSFQEKHRDWEKSELYEP